MPEQHLNVAILSMYRDQESQGMIYLKSLLENESNTIPDLSISYQIFETRELNELPKLSDFDLFISTGGPGNPHDGIGQDWENNYFEFLKNFQAHNASGVQPKFFFSICHSFQLLCRFFDIAKVVPRPQTCFGTFKCNLENSGKEDALFNKLPDPFYIVENRNWQCVLPDLEKMESQGIKILAKELNPEPAGAEPALLALRISPFWVATQFHPETNPAEMKKIYSGEKKIQEVVSKFGPVKILQILDSLNRKNPSLLDTYQCLLPEFIKSAAISKFG
jgi:GMP synthase-like glutamine amidotransferase